MSCFSCGSTFNLFKKELGCKNCGYAFCKDCLSKKAAIPKLNNEKHKVCVRCSKILSGELLPEQTNAKYSPPEALKKRLANLDSPSAKTNEGQQIRRPRQTVNTRGMSKEDAAIALRLERLKESHKEPPPPSTAEMEERLKKLKQDPIAGSPPTTQDLAERLAMVKGQNPATVNKPHVFPNQRLPVVHQVDDLLQEICDEVEIDSRQINPALDVQNRLDKYRGIPGAEPSDVQNNLNSTSCKDQFQYQKNIPHVDKDFKSSSGEEVDWSEMNRLMQEAANEAEGDAVKAVQGLQKDKELWARLSRVKEKKKDNRTSDISTDQVDNGDAAGADIEENENTACENIIKQLLEESRLEDEEDEEIMTGRKMKKSPTIPDTSNTSVDQGVDLDEDPDELPYCCICENDATLRCLGCYGDLYCKRCYREGHTREDYVDHKIKPYKPTASN